ncbi:hypothetical protein ACE3MQ_13275 [Paenibacillus lentus]|uniref:hypothetical protein n=1 Tax=Paenibacillus lentus TaxID=1338368 RepID=UPI003651F365
MRKFVKLFLPLVLLLSFAIPVNAQEVDSSENINIHGHLKTVVKFPSRSLEEVQELYKSIGTDIDTNQEDSILKLNDNIPQIELDPSFLTLKIDNNITEIKDGEFIVSNLTISKPLIQVYYSDSLIYEEEHTLVSGVNHIPLELNFDFNNLVINAGLKMNSDDSNSINKQLITPFYDPDSYYNGIKVGTYFGLGKGRMKMLTPEGHVSCNKSDYDQGKNFPLNGADCTKAVAGGLLYLNKPALYSNYAQGVFCVQEAMSSGEDSNESNSYCNHLPKNGGYYTGYKNMGYNCSSFTFLNGDERLNKY